MTDIELPAYGWRPQPHQQAAWDALAAGKKRLALSWHRRAGKDELALHWAACAAHLRVGSYWHMLPQASQARKAIWDAVNPRTGRRRIDDAFPSAIRETTREQEMFIRFRVGSTWQLVGSDNYDSLVGSPPAGVVFSEYALADPAAWSFLRPILAENGGWALFISTVRGRNHFARLVDFARSDPEWFGQVLTVDDTGVISQETIARELRELTAERGEAEAKSIIAQEYYCDPDAPMPGTYYGELMSRAEREGRIGDYPWLSDQPVGAAWDLGHGDQTVIWLYQQPRSGRVRIIDVIVGSGVGIDWYAQRLLARPYTIVDHIWPHDGRHGNIRDVSDTDLMTTARNMGVKARCLDRDTSVDVGIHAVRGMLPMIEWNATPVPLAGESLDEARARMLRGLDAIRQYRREWDEKRQRFSDAPLHDWCSDYADALRYLARGRMPFRQIGRNRDRPSTAVVNDRVLS